MDTGEGWEQKANRMQLANGAYSVPRTEGVGYLSGGGGWGNGWEGELHTGGGGADGIAEWENIDSFVRSDPQSGDLRQLVTNTVAFNHLWRTE